MKTSLLAKALGASVLLGLSTQASASGYEKSIMFGGRTSGLAGIATSYISGSESLYFNPAGLAPDKPGRDFSLNISPTFSGVKAPITGNNVESSSEKKTSLPFGMMYAHSLNEKLGVGLGVYTPAGTDVEFKDIQYTGVHGTATSKSHLTVMEVGLGAGYSISESLKIGLTYRISMVDAEFQTIDRVGATNYLNPKFKDLKASDYSGFKLGAQYKLSESTSLGLTYRSNVPFKAKGKVAGVLKTAAADRAITEQDIEVASTLPDAYTLGIVHRLTDSWALHAEYVLTAYSRVKNIQTTGTLAVPLAAISLKDRAIQQTWRDQTNVRLGAEYTGWGMPLRMGYTYTSRVSDPQYARPTFTPPGAAHTVTLGSGVHFAEAFSFNYGLEYTWVKGDGTAPAVLGEYSLATYSAHLGMGYSF